MRSCSGQEFGVEWIRRNKQKFETFIINDLEVSNVRYVGYGKSAGPVSVRSLSDFELNKKQGTKLSNHPRFGGVVAVTEYSGVLCSLIETYRHFGGMCYFHFTLSFTQKNILTFAYSSLQMDTARPC